MREHVYLRKINLWLDGIAIKATARWDSEYRAAVAISTAYRCSKS